MVMLHPSILYDHTRDTAGDEAVQLERYLVEVCSRGCVGKYVGHGPNAKQQVDAQASNHLLYEHGNDAHLMTEIDMMMPALEGASSVTGEFEV